MVSVKYGENQMTNNQAGDPQFIELVRKEQDKPMVMIPEDSSWESPQFSIPSFPCLSPVVKFWGQYWDLHRSQNTVLKRLVIYPGHRFSYQYHNKRTEFWSVEYGTGLLTLNGVAIPVGPGFSIKIDKYDKHRLANIGETDLVFYEIQSGECSEEDIVRISDDYARA